MTSCVKAEIKENEIWFEEVEYRILWDLISKINLIDKIDEVE